MLEKLKGKRTYIIAAVAAVLAFAQSMGYEIPEWVYPLLAALGLGTLRAGVAKRVAVLVLCASLAACGSLPGGMMSPGTAGAPATSGNVAQTAGEQGSAAGSSTGGTATVNYFMASSVPPGVVEKILSLAADQKWTAKQVESALRAAAGAPHEVTVTGDATATAGDADNAGAGSGGASGLSGTSGSVNRP